MQDKTRLVTASWWGGEGYQIHWRSEFRLSEASKSLSGCFNKKFEKKIIPVQIINCPSVSIKPCNESCPANRKRFCTFARAKTMAAQKKTLIATGFRKCP